MDKRACCSLITDIKQRVVQRSPDSLLNLVVGVRCANADGSDTAIGHDGLDICIIKVYQAWDCNGLYNALNHG